jgi:hypothetical protein
VKYLTQYLKISLDIVLDEKTFDASGKSGLENILSRDLLKIEAVREFLGFYA